jgi:adenylate cyclase
MLRIQVKNERQERSFDHAGSVLEFGRGPQRDQERFVIEDRYVSRDQLRIEPLPGSRVRLTNLGGPILMAGGALMNEGDIRDALLPVELSAGYTTIHIAEAAPPTKDLSTFQTISRPQSSLSRPQATLASLASLGDTPSSERLTEWFETLLSVQRAAAGSGEFYYETAKAVVELIGLDRGLVLLRQGDGWSLAGSHVAHEELGTQFSRSVLAQVVDQKRSFFQGVSQMEGAQSLVGVEAVVASPIFDSSDEVIGTVYGSRDLRTRSGIRQNSEGLLGQPAARGAFGEKAEFSRIPLQNRLRGIQPLEAQFVQLLAGAVSAGLARLEREAEASRVRVQLERFSSPELVRELQRNPGLLEGQDREITVLFSDLRGFSRISERLGAKTTYGLLSDLMDRLTNSILNHGGGIIDYAGDGLAAMWNAPLDQPDHPAMACRAALAMLGELPALNQTWEPSLGAPLRIGVGVHTGVAQVGNAGSKRRLKYGPRGHAVNLASRVEGATKHLGVPILITSTTQSRLPQSLATRRLGQVRAQGMAAPVELFELHGELADSGWSACREAYEAALVLYESGRWNEVNRHLQSPAAASDPPSLLLARRATACIQYPPEVFSPVIDLETK